MMEICCVGGYEEVGKNMTAIKIGEDVILVDCGFYLPGVIELQEENEMNYTRASLRRVGGIPDDRVLDKLGWRKNVRAIFISHAHLDHVGGLPYLIERYPEAEIFGTPFTMKVFESLVEDARIVLKNKINVVKPNSTVSVPNSKNPDLKVEFIHTTHSTLECSFIAIHTQKGIFFYTLDFKFDDHPIIENPPNYSRLKEIGQIGVEVCVMNSLYASKEKPQGGEMEAKKMLENAFSKVNPKGKAIFVTTFSSQIERLTSIVELAGKTKREIVFLGRSMAKYVGCAIDIGKCPFKDKIRILKYSRQVNSFLKKLESERDKYVVVCTGHQGEEGSILDRISKGKTPFRFIEGDNLIISSSVIPTEVNIEARKRLDEKLKKMGVNLQIDVHVHGHGGKLDKEKLLNLIKPKHIIPAHGSLEQEKEVINLAKERGYVQGKTSHLVKNGDVLKF